MPTQRTLTDLPKEIVEALEEGRAIDEELIKIVQEREKLDQKETDLLRAKAQLQQEAGRGNVRPGTPGQAGTDTGDRPMSNSKNTNARRKAQGFSDIVGMKESSAVWLTLFHSVKEEKGYSFATDLSVNSPIFYFQKAQPRDEKGRLPVLKRTFPRPSGMDMQLEILPGQIEKKTGTFKGKWVDCYPGEKEFILLEVLKKMAMDGRGTILDDRLAVSFVVSEIIEELKKIGQSANHTRIIEGLLILSRSTMVFKFLDLDESCWEESYILSLGVHGSGKDMRVFVRFNTATTDAIKEASQRIYNNKILESGNTLAIRLHQLIVFSYRQLDFKKPYELNLGEFFRIVGYQMSSRPRKSAQLMDSALDVMKTFGDIREYEKHPVYEPGNRTVVNYEYLIYPSMRLVSEVIKANTRQRERREGLKEA